MEQSERKAKERAARREMRRYRRAFAFFRFVLKPFLRRKFGYRYDDLSKIEGPYLLLANHNTEFDPMFVGLATKKQLFFVASEHIMRKGFGTWFLTRYFHPIIHRPKAHRSHCFKGCHHLHEGGSRHPEAFSEGFTERSCYCSCSCFRHRVAREQCTGN